MAQVELDEGEGGICMVLILSPGCFPVFPDLQVLKHGLSFP